MTTEDDFQAALDARPDDWQTRLVFADWLEERNDPRAGGYRALGARRHEPHSCHPDGYKAFGFGRTDNPTRSYITNPRYKDAMLPPDWLLLIPRPPLEVEGPDGATSPFNRTVWWVYRVTRRELEDAAALAFAQLPDDQRAELLRPLRRKRRSK